MEKRHDFRSKVRVKIKIGVDNVFTDGLTTDISKDGLAFVTKYVPKSKGVVIAMENGGNVSALVGKCCYIKHLRDGSQLTKVGIKLISESDDYKYLIDSLEINNS